MTAQGRPAEIGDEPPPYDTVVFDCDSTLSAIEGIEELVRGDPEIQRLTREAMTDGVPLERVYARRLERARPSRSDVSRIGARYIETMLSNVAALVSALHLLKKRVHIVSGGLLPAVRILGRALTIPDELIHAVDVHFDARGDYAGFDEASPLARSGGKIVVLESLRRTKERLALVGDGATDLEAAPYCERFIAFGGVECRPAVMHAARIRCLEPDFRCLAPLLLSDEEIAILADSHAHRALVRLPTGPTPPTA